MVATVIPNAKQTLAQVVPQWMSFSRAHSTFYAAITLTENKKCAKYAKYVSLRPIVLDSTFLYADDGSLSEYACQWNTTTTKVQRGMRVLHLTSTLGGC